MRGFCGVVRFAEGEIDLRAGRQASFFRQGGFRLVADVRLDDRTDLLRQLADLLPGREPGDAELLLAAYLRWGTSCPEHLLGDFAFAIWDPRHRQIFCARDPLGVKPLHVARVGSLLCFATEAQQVLRHPAVPRGLDERTIADYLMDLPDDPARTFFLGVSRVPPAHRLIATGDGDRLERYWDADPSRQITYRKDREYADHFLHVFERSVADRLRAPAGPVGIALSGGLDSSAVAAVASKSGRLFACSFVFSTLRDCDERSYIAETAAALSLDSELIEAERFWPLGDREAYRPRIESPFLAWESSFRQMLSRVRARSGRILLTGHGGDDLMAGSPLVYADRLVRGDLGVLPQTLRYALSQGRSAGRILYRYYGQPLLPACIDRRLSRLFRRSTAEIPDWIRPELVQRTQLAERLEDAPPAHHPRGAAWQELRDQVARFYPWDRAVHWYGAQAAPFGIEVRHPFLDRRIAEFLLAIPPRQRSEPGVYKPLLRRAMDTLLPERVRQRRDKTWLGAFIDLGFRDKEAKRVEALLQAPLAAELGIVDACKLRAAFEKYRDRKTESAPGVWYAVTLELWLQEILSEGMRSTPGAPVESDSLRTVA